VHEVTGQGPSWTCSAERAAAVIVQGATGDEIVEGKESGVLGQAVPLTGLACSTCTSTVFCSVKTPLSLAGRPMV
jgi:hypothetical protein